MTETSPLGLFPREWPTAQQLRQAKHCALACVDAAEHFQEVLRRHGSPDNSGAAALAEAYEGVLNAYDEYSTVPRLVRKALTKVRRSDHLDLQSQIPYPSDHRDGWGLTATIRQRTRLTFEANPCKHLEYLPDRFRACWDEVRLLVASESAYGADACRDLKAKIMAEHSRAEGHLKVLSQPALDRLIYDDYTSTVTVDGVDYKVEDRKVYALYQTIAKSKTPLTKALLAQELPGLKGDKTIPRLLDKLPEALRETVKGGLHGYWVELPKKNSRELTGG
jgi:hypothetical protein